MARGASAGVCPRLLATLYSPELNPIERVWKRTRRNCVHNVYFSTLQALVDRVVLEAGQKSTPQAEAALPERVLSFSGLSSSESFFRTF